MTRSSGSSRRFWETSMTRSCPTTSRSSISSWALTTSRRHAARHWPKGTDLAWCRDAQGPFSEPSFNAQSEAALSACARELVNFFRENVLLLARDARQSLVTKTPRATDVRNYLRQSLDAAYNALGSATQHGVSSSAVCQRRAHGRDHNRRPGAEVRYSRHAQELARAV